MLRSVTRYPGGKAAVADYLVSRFPSDISEYREPFVGGGSVYLAARQLEVSKRYWINDRFSWLCAFWRTCANQEDCILLVEKLLEVRRFLTSPVQVNAYFRSVKDNDPVDQLQKAFLFFFFNRITFSGTTAAGGFSSSAAMERFTVSSIKKLLKLPPLLKWTCITDFDFSDVISLSGNNVFVFCDPPYYTAKKLYGKKGELHNFDHERLAHCLHNTEHKFLMTYDDCPEIRDLYRWATIEEFGLQYSMVKEDSEGKRRKGRELLIRNY